MSHTKLFTNRKGIRAQGRGIPSLYIKACLEYKKQYFMSVKQRCKHWDSRDDILVRGNGMSQYLLYKSKVKSIANKSFRLIRKNLNGY